MPCLILSNTFAIGISAAVLLLAIGQPARAEEHNKRCLAAPQGLISWWPGDGNANDIAGVNHGQLNGGAAFARGLLTRLSNSTA
jgi:hypothetical protein